MFKTFHIVSLLLLFGMTAVASLGQSGWPGRYEFGEDGGRNAGGTAIFIQHDLEIVEGDDGLIAFLKSNGYQTSKDLVCKATVTGDKLSVYFESYGEDNIFESYEKGDLLLTLERKTEKGKRSILTHWGKFTPSIAKNERSGKVYFTRSEPAKNEE